MKKVIITSGYYNPLHVGHISLFKEAKNLGDFLVVIVNSDAQAKIKKSIPFMPEQERVEVIKSLKPVDEVFLSIDTGLSIAQSLKEIAKKYPHDQLFFAKGGDRHSGNIPQEEIDVCIKYKIQIINGVGGGKVQSSSWLIENVVNAFFQIKKNPFIQDNHQIMKKTFPSITVLGNKIDMVQIPEVLDIMTHWIEKEREKNHWIVATGMHGVMEAEKNSEFKQKLSQADIWAPDGISLIWLARMNRFYLKERVAGPDLFHAFLKLSAQKGYKNYFFGDTDETLKKLKETLEKDCAGIKIDSFSPPFRKTSKEEDEAMIQKINDYQPDVLWVGLGLPKQENWIFEHRDKLKVPVIVGVGAAFKFEANMVSRAPSWIGNAGFEWLWRLFLEPKTTWKRVFFDAPRFIYFVLREKIREKVRLRNKK